MAEERRKGAPESEPEVEGPAPPELVIITGLAGAGRSTAIHTFEDLGFFCIDNLPPTLLGQLIDLASLPGSRVERLAVVCDIRSLDFFDELFGELGKLADRGQPFRLLFLEADERVLVQRFKETRRRHPLAGQGSVVTGIRAERKALAPVRGAADYIIDTSQISRKELSVAIRERFLAEPVEETLAVTIQSFGFKYGVPTDADIVMDVRFLPNPYYVKRLRAHTGLEKRVREYVLDRDETHTFLEKWFEMLRLLLPGYIAEGKTHLMMALGCTGGMHRSVCLSEETAEFLRGEGYEVTVVHRDLGKDRERA